jgi:DNA adenine methylase
VHKLFAYLGGKWPIRKQIVAAFPGHTTYVDAFGGSASILLTKQRSRGEVFNDKNEEIVNFFRIVKHRPAELIEESYHWLHSRRMFNDMLNSPASLDEIGHALRFWIVTADSFGAVGDTFGTARKGIRSVTHARAYIGEVSARLADVHIECLDANKCIQLYDSPETFVYCDPPYPGTAGGDNHYTLLTGAEWKVLFATLDSIEGKFLLSCNPHPMVLQLFKEYHVQELEVPQTLSRTKKSQKRTEVLISNYTLPAYSAGSLKCCR